MKAKRLEGLAILVVEDNYMVAANLSDALGYAGARVVGIVGNLEEAVLFARNRHRDIDVALLDVNLGGVMSYPIADILRRHDVPVIFTTGYDNSSMDIAYRDFPVCMKPFSFESVVAAIRLAHDSKARPDRVEK